MTFKPRDRNHFMRLVNDCITYDLKENEALQYIKISFRELSTSSYWRYRRKIESEGMSQVWLNQFSKIGFVQHHRRLLLDAKRIYNDSLRRYFREHAKPVERQNRELLLRMEHSFRENAKLLASLGMSTPVVAAIKAQIQDSFKQEKENDTRIQEGITGSGNTLIQLGYPKYDKFISRVSESDVTGTDEQDDSESEDAGDYEGKTLPDHETFSRTTEKRIRTRNDEFIEGGANVTDRVF